MYNVGMKRPGPFLVLLFLALLSGCARDPGRRKTTLTIWSAPRGVEERAFLKLIARFEREHPHIRVHNLGGMTEEKLVRAVVAGAPPDLAYVYNMTLVGPLAANHAVQPLDQRFSRSGLREEDFLPGAIAQARYEGRLYAMPVTRDSRGLYWNRTVFRQAGLDPDRPPQTMDELYRYALKLTERKADGSLKRVGFMPPTDSTIWLCAMGGRLYDERTRRVMIDCPENVTALTWLVKLVNAQGGRSRLAAFRSGFGPNDSAQNPLAMGHVAMQFDGEWFAMYLERYAPHADYGIGEIPYPDGRPDLKNMAWQDGDFMFIPVGARNPDAAWEFIRWLQQPRQQEEYAGAMSNLPTLRALMHSPSLTQGSRSKETLGYILAHISGGSRNIRIFPSLPVTKLYRDTLDNAFQAAQLGQKTPEQALTDAQARVQKELDKYLR
jgi:multiple sugar transport system substrate-binding protein